MRLQQGVCLLAGAVAVAAQITDKLTCGINGYDLQNPQATYADSSGASGSFSTCQTFCREYKSFAFSTQQCLCYTAVVAGNINPVESSPFAFFDIDCPAPPTTTTTTTFTTTTTATTTVETTSASTTTTDVTTTTSTTTSEPVPTTPAPPKCFRVQASSERRTIDQNWLKAPHGDGLLLFTSLERFATIFTLNQSQQLINTENGAFASRHRLGRTQYGPAYMHRNAGRFDFVSCTINSEGKDVLDCETTRGDSGYTLGHILYIGQGVTRAQYPVQMNVIAAQCPFGY